MISEMGYNKLDALADRFLDISEKVTAKTVTKITESLREDNKEKAIELMLTLDRYQQYAYIDTMKLGAVTEDQKEAVADFVNTFEWEVALITR